jgi:hypothetical protein
MDIIQERTLDIGIWCITANYVGTSEYYRVIKHKYIGTHIMHCLVKGTLSRQPWFVFCVRRGAGGIVRAAMLVHPKSASLLRFGGEKRRRQPRRRRHSESTSLCIYKVLKYRLSLRFLCHAARNKNTIENSFQQAHYDLRSTRNMASTTCLDRNDGTHCKQCHHYADGLMQGSKIVVISSSRDSLGPKFYCADNQTPLPPPPQVSEERRKIFHDLDIQGAASTSPNSSTPRRVRRRRHTSPSVYAVPGSDEFKKKENKIREIPSKAYSSHSCA